MKPAHIIAIILVLASIALAGGAVVMFRRYKSATAAETKPTEQS